MVPPDTAPALSRQERRKAATRAKILRAADELFGERGYAETSIEDIADAADVAVRTIYTHFPSKASIMLAYFDGWLDAFVAAIMRRPLTEPVVDTVRESLAALSADGWTERVEGGNTRVHPLVEHLGAGSPDIAGHVMHRWVEAQSRLAADARERGQWAAGSLVPQARAAAVFAAWIATMSAAHQKQLGHELPERATGGSIGLDILSHITSGGL